MMQYLNARIIPHLVIVFFLFYINNIQANSANLLSIKKHATDNHFSHQISQDHHDNFWLTTDNGLYRFNGLQSQRVSANIIEQLKGQKFPRIISDKNILWLKSDVGIEQVDLTSQTSQVITTKTTKNLIVDEQNNLWFLAEGALYKAEDQHVINRNFFSSEGINIMLKSP